MNFFKKAGLFFVMVALIFLGRSSLGLNAMHGVDKFSSIFITPVLKVVKTIAIPFESLNSWWRTTRNLHNEVSFLRKQVVDLQAQNIMYRASQVYYNDIQELVEYRKRYEQEGIFAPILLSNLTSLEHTALIDRGSYHGVQEDMIAVHKNIVVGKVAEVYPFYSKIYLITDRRCRIPAICSSTGARGVHQGLNQVDKTQLNFISHLEDVELGDTILTSGQGLVFPSGLGIGTITEVRKDKLGVNWEIDIKPYCDPSLLQVVSLIKR